MDIANILKNINNLNEYIAITQDVTQKCKMSKIDLSLSTAHSLKKIRSFEIEHVNKCEENGIACVIFERMLSWPPSKTWRMLSKELVLLLQYWLDAVRKHLVKHSPHWWTFLKLLLKFIKELGQKHNTIPNMLVEHTAECLLDLATNEKPDAMQKFEILHCFNIYCSESSKELRFALRNKFLDYFTKLGTYMCNCGHLPTQYTIIETLLRWMLPRKDAALRIACATKWFPARLYSDEVVDIFLARPWTSFIQDARDMLNKHNDSGDLITSVICRKLTVGDIVIIPNADETDSWLDINAASRSLSVLLGSRELEKFGCPYHRSFEVFYVSDDNVQTASLYRESQRIVLSVQTVTTPLIMPSCIKLSDDVSCHVTVVVTSQCDVKRLDNALRNIFENKYQMLMDIEKEVTPPAETEDIPPIITEEQKKKIELMLNNLRKQLTQTHTKETEDVVKNNESEEHVGTSHAGEIRRTRDSDYKTLKLRQPVSCVSPSTASTSSLAQLHEKLAALPRHRFEKETPWTAAAPDLSVVTEVSEPDDQSTSTIEYKAYGVCSRTKKILDRSKRSQSDNETCRRYPGASKKEKSRPLSPIVQYKPANSLLSATLESAPDSVINDTAEKITKLKDFDTVNVDLLYQEAIQASQEKNKDKNDSGINTQEKKWQDVNEVSDAIENTPNNENCQPKQKSKVIFSTSDESNTEAISDTPNMYVTTRRNKKSAPKVALERQSFDVQIVEEFFSQHFTENKAGDIVISPKLARKMNETSSEASDDLQDIEPYDFNNFEVIECLNNIVNKVCDEFDKCTKYLNKEEPIIADNTSDHEDNVPLQDIMNKMQNLDSKNQTVKKSPAAKVIKLRYKAAPKKKKPIPRTTKQKLEVESTAKVSTRSDDKIEVVTETDIQHVLEDDLEKSKKESLVEDTNVPTTPVLRRKRKLFSPKDEQVSEEHVEHVLSQPEENYFTNSKIKKTPKSTGTYKPYKEIEKERQRIRIPRNRKSRNVEPESPRSKKMNDLFNKVKQSANGEKVTLANKTSNFDVFNFSTDSEDDFKEKKINISKKASNTTIDSLESTVLRRGRIVKRVNYASSNNSKKTKRKTNNRQNKKEQQATKTKINKELNHDLVDQRMRETKEALDTSLVIENPTIILPEPQLVLEKQPEMEIINEKEESANEIQHKTRRTRRNKSKTVDSKKGLNKKLNIKANVDNNRTESPLPGLVVEEAPAIRKEDGDLSANMVDKFKKICQNPEKYINESNTTQNLLSDNERNISPQMNETIDELIEVKPKLTTEKKPKGKLAKNKKASVKARKVDNKVQPQKEINEILNITVSGTKSDKSIATSGINGHGDSEEAPPSSKLIIQTLKHRNLESEYLDHSTKEYYEKLTEAINDFNDICRNDANDNPATSKPDVVKNIDNNSKSIESSKCLKSPVVSIERISLEDISRWLPSRRNSDSDYNTPSSNKSKPKRQIVNKNIENTKIVQSKRVVDSDDEPDTEHPIRRLRSNYDKSPVLKTNIGVGKKPRNVSYHSDNSVNSIPVSIKSKNNEKARRILPPRRVKCTQEHKSIISPIKLFDDLISNADKVSQTTLSDDEEYMNEIKDTLWKQIKKTQLNEEELTQESKRAKKYDKEIVNTTVQQQFIPRSKSAHSQYRDDSRMLKRGSEQEREVSKKQKVEDNNNIEDLVSACQSGVTISSVDDWFKRSEPGSSRAENINTLTRDSIQTVIEKLDTTLIEIHQNTSNKFVHLFVSAQQQLHELKRERQNLYKRVAADLLSSIINLVDDKFADLDKRSQEQDSNFIKQLKERASTIIREDLKQKRVMVQLLKEDVLAVAEHVAKRND